MNFQQSLLPYLESHVTRKHLFLMKPKPMAGLHSDTKICSTGFLEIHFTDKSMISPNFNEVIAM